MEIINQSIEKISKNSSKETYYKDIRFEYIPYINDTTKIIGHIHKDNRRCANYAGQATSADFINTANTIVCE